MTPHLEKPAWDAFISHASEDKERFVRPLACALSALGASIWYDEFALKIGDSISRSIDKGLAQSRYGILILSSAFMSKSWPEYELRGLTSLEVAKHSVILPIWHGVDREDVIAFSPSLADKFAIKTANLSAREIALQILSVIRPDIYGGHPHAELQRLVGGEAVQALQNELTLLRGQLAEFECPFCGAPLVESQQVPLDQEQKHFDSLRSFECGFTELAGGVQHPCPADQNFPKLDDYELQCREHPSETLTMFRWTCDALPKTIMARSVRLQSTYGPTEEVARAELQRQYQQRARVRKWR